MPLRRGQLLEALALLAILALAAWLRFGWIGVNSFAFDEARLSLISLRMARGGEFASLGMPSSAGVPNLPGAAWLFALPYALSTDPLIATWFVGLLSLLAVIGAWWLARRAWGAWAGLAAALYLAASPYAVLYSRSVWAQDLLPSLAVLWLALAFLAIDSRRRWALALHIFVAGFAVQVHFAGAALALGSLYLFVRFRWWRQIVPVLVGGALVLLTFTPPALALLNNADVASRFGGAVGSPAQIDLSALDALLQMAFGVEWGYLAAGDVELGVETNVLALLIVLVAGIAAVGFALYRQRETGEPSRAALLSELALVLLLAPVIAFLRHSTPVFLHYLLPALPAVALIAGASTQVIRRRWSLLPLFLLGMTAAVWTAHLAAHLDIAGRSETPNGLGTPLGLLRDAAYSVPDELPVLLFTHGDDPNVDGEAAVFEALWWGRPHRIVQGESVLILPPEPATLMATLAPFQAWEELEAAGLAQNVIEFPRREGALPFVATLYDGQSEPTGFTPLEPPIRFEDGTQLEGWRWRWVGPRLRISTLWRVIEPPTGATFQQFHHLRTEATREGEPYQGADVPLSVYRWREGDHVIVMGDFFDVPPGEYTVDIGHYTLPDIARIPRTDGGELVTLGSFIVE